MIPVSSIRHDIAFNLKLAIIKFSRRISSDGTIFLI